MITEKKQQQMKQTGHDNSKVLILITERSTRKKEKKAKSQSKQEKR